MKSELQSERQNRMKVRGRARSYVTCEQSVSLPVALIMCFLLFVAGYYSATSLLQDPLDDFSFPSVQRQKLLQSDSSGEAFVVVDHGKSGDNNIQISPFQVCNYVFAHLFFI
ncbi:hypothetical protein O6H91_Y465900 [Diphasiastrum complanatum]|nr:hypothetical protein O6H91_Y465900 [Diphasiastrum complanatum]